MGVGWGSQGWAKLLLVLISLNWATGGLFNVRQRSLLRFKEDNGEIGDLLDDEDESAENLRINLENTDSDTNGATEKNIQTFPSQDSPNDTNTDSKNERPNNVFPPLTLEEQNVTFSVKPNLNEDIVVKVLFQKSLEDWTNEKSNVSGFKYPEEFAESQINNNTLAAPQGKIVEVITIPFVLEIEMKNTTAGNKQFPFLGSLFGGGRPGGGASGVGGGGGGSFGSMLNGFMHLLNTMKPGIMGMPPLSGSSSSSSGVGNGPRPLPSPSSDHPPSSSGGASAEDSSSHTSGGNGTSRTSSSTSFLDSMSVSNPHRNKVVMSSDSDTRQFYQCIPNGQFCQTFWHTRPCCNNKFCKPTYYAETILQVIAQGNIGICED